jgi:hypothetical protein
MAHWMKVVRFVDYKEETHALAALMRFDFARLNEVMAVFRRFIKFAEGNSVSYSDIFPMLEKLMANLSALYANKHSEAFMNAVSTALFRNNGCEHNSCMRSGDANWKKKLQRCYAITRVRRKHGNDVQEGRCYIIESVSLRRCSDDQSLPGLLGQSGPVPLSEGFVHILSSAGFHSRPETRH